MARNIEIKAHIESVEALAARAAAIASAGPIEIDQDDTFFRCEAGRLKLRAFSNESGELIFYRFVCAAAYFDTVNSSPACLRIYQACSQARVG